MAQRHPLRPEMSKVLEVVAKTYNIEVADLFIPRAFTQAREVAIFLCRKLAGCDLIFIANEFKISYSQVSRITGKARDKIGADKKFMNKVKIVEDGINGINGIKI